MDGGVWWATVQRGHKELGTTERRHFTFNQGLCYDFLIRVRAYFVGFPGGSNG